MHIRVVWEKLSTITITDVARTVGIYRYNVCHKKDGGNNFDLAATKLYCYHERDTVT